MATVTASPIPSQNDKIVIVAPLLAALLVASGPAQAEPLVALPWLAAVLILHGLGPVLTRRLTLPGVLEAVHVLLWTIPPALLWSPDNAAQNVLIALVVTARLAIAGPMRPLLLDRLPYSAESEALIETLAREKSVTEAARRRAEAESQAKSQFLATMSHELRTPLNAILGFSDVLRHEMLGPLNVKRYRVYADDIHTSGEHLLALINDVLDLSRIEAGRYELHEEPVSLSHIARECCNLLSLKAGERGVEIIETYEPGLPMVTADARAIRQIWLNLISNAVKFTPSGGRIAVSVGRNGHGAPVLAVRDNGPGIPADELATVLKPFSQAASAAPENRRQGVGLGLPIVEGLATLHGGRLMLASEPGKGTRAAVELPPGRVLPGRIAPAEPAEEPLDGRRLLVALTA